MGTYYTLLNAFAEDGRLEEAEELWTKIFSENLESLPRTFFIKMISIYHSKGMHEKMFEVYYTQLHIFLLGNIEILLLIYNVCFPLPPTIYLILVLIDRLLKYHFRSLMIIFWTFSEEIISSKYYWDLRSNLEI